jgi:hypothetical protein
MNFQIAESQVSFGNKLHEIKENPRKVQRAIKNLFNVDLDLPVKREAYGKVLVLSEQKTQERYCLYFRDSVLFITGGKDYLDDSLSSKTTKLKSLITEIEFTALNLR